MMPDTGKAIGDLEGLTWDDWYEWHSDSEVRQIAKDAIKLLKEQEEKIRSMEQTIEDICCGGSR